MLNKELVWAFSVLLPMILTGCSSVKGEDIAGYHKNWPGKILVAATNIEEGQKVTSKDLALESHTRAGSPIDALCFQEEALGTTARYPIPQGAAVTFHSLNAAKNIQEPPAQGGAETSQPAANTSAPLTKIVVAHRRIPKGSIILVEWLDEVEIPKSEVSIDSFNSSLAVEGFMAAFDIEPKEVVSNYAVKVAKSKQDP